MASPSTADATTLATLTALEHRLHRLTFYLTGSPNAGELPPNIQAQFDRKERTASPQARLAGLEVQLAQLAEKRPGVRSLLELQSKHPDLFSPPSYSTTTTTTSNTSSQPPASLLPPSNLLALAVSLAPEIQTTASRLTSLQDLLPPPSPSDLAPFLSTHLAPRILRAEERQEEVEREIDQLRERSARLVQGWVEEGVIGGGGVWGGWERRVAAVEGRIRKEEVGREREEKEV